MLFAVKLSSAACANVRLISTARTDSNNGASATVLLPPPQWSSSNLPAPLLPADASFLASLAWRQSQFRQCTSQGKFGFENWPSGCLYTSFRPSSSSKASCTKSRSTAKRLRFHRPTTSTFAPLTSAASIACNRKLLSSCAAAIHLFPWVEFSKAASSSSGSGCPRFKSRSRTSWYARHTMSSPESVEWNCAERKPCPMTRPQAVGLEASARSRQVHSCSSLPSPNSGSTRMGSVLSTSMATEMGRENMGTSVGLMRLCSSAFGSHIDSSRETPSACLSAQGRRTASGPARCRNSLAGEAKILALSTTSGGMAPLKSALRSSTLSASCSSYLSTSI
mmetsp:Transcript_339/g.658  ORF Transcript_339/g.658 Transcript_339/m.658 type:complete len:336 (-) Transcript_339:161-1168(-)